MSEQERIDRQELLKRAAVAGAAYVAPVLTSSASAETQACAGQTCKPGRKGKKKCRKVGGRGCKCDGGACSQPCAQCSRQADSCNDQVEPCGDCGDGVCFADASGGEVCGPGPHKGVCVHLGSGLCADFTLCDVNNNCPSGQCCFSSCCDCLTDRPPLCGDVCGGTPRAKVKLAPKGALVYRR